MKNETIDMKFDKLLEAIRKLESVAIAFSGGVDSTFLAYAAKVALGDRAIAITVESPYIPKWELEEAKDLAKSIGIRHHIVKLDHIPQSIEMNPENRCYLCKKSVFDIIKRQAEAMDLSFVMDGSNHDDTKDYRPGMVALKELEIMSPLLTEIWSKAEIRQASKQFGLPTHDKPAYACLLTRIPYNTEVLTEDLERIEKSEVYMMSRGFRAVRVRSHGNLARIEVNRDDRRKLFDEVLLDDISETLKTYGYTYVTLEIGGYEMGSFNKTLTGKH